MDKSNLQEMMEEREALAWILTSSNLGLEAFYFHKGKFKFCIMGFRGSDGSTNFLKAINEEDWKYIKNEVRNHVMSLCENDDIWNVLQEEFIYWKNELKDKKSYHWKKWINEEKPQLINYYQSISKGA